MGNNYIVDRREILRYLGYKGQEINHNINNIIDECIVEIKNLAKFKYTFRRFHIENHHEKVHIKNCDLKFEGRDIYNHLIHSKSCILIAATLGVYVDRAILLYEKINIVKSIILDATATAYVEKSLDNVQEQLKLQLEKEGFNLTFRYSPGYGDFKVDIQKDLLKVLSAETTIGLTATEHNILIPRKSVTAVFGVIPKNINVNTPSCNNCNKFHDCVFRKVGEGCGH